MPHGTLQIGVAGDPSPAEIAALLTVTETIYGRIYLIQKAATFPRRQLEARLRTPSQFIPSEDRLRLHSLTRGSLEAVLFGFIQALAGTASYLVIPLVAAKTLKLLAEARKLNAQAKRIKTRTVRLRDRAARSKKGAAASIRRWIKSLLEARDGLRNSGIEIDLSELQKYPETEKQFKATLRHAGVPPRRAQRITDGLLEVLTELRGIGITKIELR
ncbi:MAG: hypothetical protein ACRD1X_03190 [Vicinamibacteria bacterium]